jgi:hypothetical protein
VFVTCNLSLNGCVYILLKIGAQLICYRYKLTCIQKNWIYRNAIFLEFSYLPYFDYAVWTAVGTASKKPKKCLSLASVVANFTELSLMHNIFCKLKKTQSDQWAYRHITETTSLNMFLTSQIYKFRNEQFQA